jgi:hypothetical protein
MVGTGTAVGQRPLNPDLPLNVVRGRQDGATRRAPQDQLARRAAQQVRQIRFPAGDKTGLDLPHWSSPVVRHSSGPSKSGRVSDHVPLTALVMHPTVSLVCHHGLSAATVVARMHRGSVVPLPISLTASSLPARR